MKILFLGLMMLGSMAQAAPLDCTALKREILPNNQTRETKKALEVNWSSGNASILQAEIDDRAYTVTTASTPETYLISITQGPDFTKGSLATVAPNMDGRLQISTVDGGLVHKLECFRKASN